MNRRRQIRPRPSKAQQSLDAILGPLDGAEIPGGCLECDAYQVPAKLEMGVYSIHVYHDPDCPFLAARSASAR